MNIKEVLTKDIINAMKAKDKFKLNVLRMLKGNIQLQEINKKESLTDKEIIAAVSKEIKTRKESVVEFKKGNREDLVQKNLKEIEILMVFLPKQLSSEELNKIIDKSISTLDEKNPRQMGAVIKLIAPLVAGKADMREVSNMIKEKLK